MATSAPPLPRLIVFDVNETLSDMSELADRFAEVGAPESLAATWFAGLLRDGFALTSTGDNPSFAGLATESLGEVLRIHHVPDIAGGIDTIMAAFGALPVHPDVVDGVCALADLGIRLVTLSNGATSLAQGLFERNGISDRFERLLSVEDAPSWKPTDAAYQYALDQCDVPAEESLLVAVHPWDVHGARRAGLSAAYLNRTSAAYPAYFESPTIEVGSLTELAGLWGPGPA